MKIAFYVFGFLIGFAQVASTANLPDFSGVWTSTRGTPAQEEIGSIVMRISQNNNALRVAYGDQASAQSQEFIVDGAERGSQNSSYIAKWDGEKIVIERHVSGVNTPFGMANFMEQEVWTLSADGKVLTISHGATAGASGRKLAQVEQVFNKSDVQN